MLMSIEYLREYVGISISLFSDLPLARTRVVFSIAMSFGLVNIPGMALFSYLPRHLSLIPLSLLVAGIPRRSVLRSLTAVRLASACYTACSYAQPLTACSLPFLQLINACTFSASFGT